MIRCVLRLGLLIVVVPLFATANDERPNILFIFADDQCFDTINALGNDEVITPNLDRLAARGTTFTHAYNMGSWSGAVCVASRTMLNTGRFVWNAHAVYPESERERRRGRWWSEYLKAAGYRTYMTGKWHCRADAAKSFDVIRDVRGGMPRTLPSAYNRPTSDVTNSWSPSDPKLGGFWEGGTHWSEVVARHARGFLADASSREEPFFMYLAFNAVHDPRQSPAEYINRYPVDDVRIPDNFQSTYPFADKIGCGRELRDERLAPFPRTARAVQVHRQEYYAILSHMDAMIGEIIDTLEATNQSTNTWVFFTADHGLAVGQHGLLGKQNMYDHSVRVPFIVVGPNVEAGARIAEPIYLQDVMPTTLELAGIDKPGHVEFHSLLPMLDGAPSPYDEIYGCYLEKQRSIRTREYKLIAYPDARKLRLYNLVDDPKENKDIANEAKSEPLMVALYDRLVALQRQMNDELDLSQLDPRTAAKGGLRQ